MVIEPREGRVLHGLNANELMDVQEETFQLNSIMYVGKLNYYRNLIIIIIIIIALYCYTGLIQLKEATSIF